jgi:hypothetical protein
MPTNLSRSGSKNQMAASAGSGQSQVIDQATSIARLKAVRRTRLRPILAAGAHHLAVLFLHLSGTVSGQSNREQILGKLPPIGMGKTAALVPSHWRVLFEKASVP